MELLVGLVVLAIVAFLFAGPVLLVQALMRIRRLQRRVERLDRLELDLARLEHRLAELDSREIPELAAAPAAPPPPDEPRTAAPPEPPPLVLVLSEIEPPEPAPPEPAPEAAAGAPSPWLRGGLEWVGIRGAAILGALALALAGVLFFRYSIERGMITPGMRVICGALAGLVCLGGSRILKWRRYGAAAEAVAGAGVVILYAAFWAAHVVYGLIGVVFAFMLMVLVTLICCVIALRDSSLLVAVLGLAGGFATPLLLSGGADRPFGLFAYVLLLDLVLLLLGHERRWPTLGLLSLLGTTLIQWVWIGGAMGPERIFLGLAILAVFALLFAASGRFAEEGEPRRLWLWSAALAVFIPVAFATYFASRFDLGERLYPLALLLALLAMVASWLSRERELQALRSGAAIAAVAVVAVWQVQQRLDAVAAWELAVVAAGLSLVFHTFVERNPLPWGPEGPAPAAMLATGGFFVVLPHAAASAPEVPPWPWVAGWAALVALCYRQGGFPRRAPLQVAAALGLGLGLSSLHLFHHAHPSFPPRGSFLALLVVSALVLLALAQARRGSVAGVYADHAAATLPAVLLFGLAISPFAPALSAGPLLGTALLLGSCMLVAAMRLGSGAWYAGAVAATALVHAMWTWKRPGLGDRVGESSTALAVELAAVVVFTGWLFLPPRRFASERFACWAAALAGPIWFLPLRHVFRLAFGGAFMGLLPVALALLSLAAVVLTLCAWPREGSGRPGAVVWFSAVALAFLSLAIPMQLEKEWITIGWALEGLAVLALWRWLDHPGLKYFGLVLLGAVTVRLVVNPALLGYYPRPEVRFLNWLLYAYLVPAATLLGGAAILKAREVQALRDWEVRFYGRPLAFGAILSSLAAIGVVFVWINLVIADGLATGSTLSLAFGSTPGQRLTVSLAWAVYAGVLLGLGMSRAVQGLRWLSLGFLLVTIAKVFLYDLGTLEDLYRAASLVGLAVSLILVSLLYQRFVFRARKDGLREPRLAPDGDDG